MIDDPSINSRLMMIGVAKYLGISPREVLKLDLRDIMLIQKIQELNTKNVNKTT